MQINLLFEKHHMPFPEKIKIVQEFTGICSSVTTIFINGNTNTQVSGVHTMIEGNIDDIVEWLTQNQPVYVGTASNPMLEQFKQWMTEEYAIALERSKIVSNPRSYIQYKNSNPHKLTPRKRKLPRYRRGK
jgi:hypothetical protein